MTVNLSEWQNGWTAMIAVPGSITDDMFERAVAKERLASLGEMSLESLHEGRCVETVPYRCLRRRSCSLRKMHDEVIPNAGLRLSGKHHEIQLSDAQRVEPAKLRTILGPPTALAQGLRHLYLNGFSSLDGFGP